MGFDIASLRSGTKRSFFVSHPLRTQVVAARGRRAGKTILVLGGVHGDEYEGPMAIHQVFAGLRPSEMAGNFIGVPICNPLAFAAKQRATPRDGRDLARCFPGTARGTITERIAHRLHHEFIARADFLIDLHSSGSQWVMPTLSGYTLGTPALVRLQHQACLRFGAPVIWASPNAAGRTLSSARQLGIPGIYTETAGRNGCRGADVDLYAQGVRNVMAWLRILPPSRARRVSPPQLVIRENVGYGNLDTSVKAQHHGLFVARREILSRVKRGDLIGEMFSPEGGRLETFRASRDGHLFLVRHASPVRKGDLVFQVT